MKRAEEVWDVYSIRAVIITSAIGVGLILVTFWYFKTGNVSEILTAIFLYLTFIMIIWYSWETRQLKIETRRLRKWAAKENSILSKQSVIDIRPYLRLQQTPDHLLQLVNEGKGIAVNLQPSYVKGGKRFPLLMIPAMAAAPNSNTTSFIPKFLPANIKLNPETEEYMIRVTYTDIEGRKYEAVFQSDVEFNDKFSIIYQEEEARPPKDK